MFRIKVLHLGSVNQSINQSINLATLLLKSLYIAHLDGQRLVKQQLRGGRRLGSSWLFYHCSIAHTSGDFVVSRTEKRELSENLFLEKRTSSRAYVLFLQYRTYDQY